ncbi:TIGD1 protein, partial [Crocuta crocuta]
MAKRRVWFLQMESAPSEDAVKVGEMTTKDLECYTDLVVKATSGFERTDSRFERSSTMGEMLSHSTTRYRAVTSERKSQSMKKILVWFYFKKLLQLLQPPAITILISQQ